MDEKKLNNDELLNKLKDGYIYHSQNILNGNTIDKKNISNEELLDMIKHGYVWHAQKIKEELGKLLVMNSSRFNHDFQYDTNEKYHFIYDNECYLFIFDGRIEVRCDRENIFSSDKTFTHEIKNSKDILAAYEQFNSITIEDENEDD